MLRCFGVYIQSSSSFLYEVELIVVPWEEAAP